MTDSMFQVSREVPWHGLGMNVGKAPNSTAALRLAGLNWKVIQAPLYYTIAGVDQEVTNRVANYRSDTGEYFGVVSNRYKIVQNEEAFSFTDSLLGEGIQYETAGSLNGGRRVWLLAKMPERKILGDKFLPYLLFSNGHDGGTAVRVCMTPVRVVCANTLQLALETACRTWVYYHRGKIDRKLDEANTTLQLAGNYMTALTKEAEHLAVKKMGQRSLAKFIEQLFPMEGTDRQKANVKNEIAYFQSCYMVDDLTNFRNTKWGVIAAISDYATHKPIKNAKQQESLFAKTVGGHPLIDRALQLIRSI